MRTKKTLFIFLAHEEKGQPYTGSAKMCKRLAKVIVHIDCFTASFSGRCPGGVLQIDKDLAETILGINKGIEAL